VIAGQAMYRTRHSRKQIFEAQIRRFCFILTHVTGHGDNVCVPSAGFYVRQNYLKGGVGNFAAQA
jgi:hypothetical protein